MPDITVTITDEELRALAYVAVAPIEWINNLVRARASAAMQEIYEKEMARLMSDPDIEFIPAKRDEVVRNAKIKSAAERHAETLANMPIPEKPDGLQLP